MTEERKIEWKWGALAALAMTIIALYPQLDLWLARGSDWQGSYALTQGDEITYSAYVNALIDGRPRKNDPFSGRDAVGVEPLYESLHSIHFVPAYVVALPARALGLTAATAFILLLVVAAISATLALYWLLALLTGDSKLAAVGALVILCFGALVGSECCWSANAFTEMIPFLRRYHPAASFPLFFLFCVFIWHALTRERSKTRLIYAAGAGAALSVMVFSYFYIWTAAVAWLACVSLLWLLFRRDQFKQIVLAIVVVAVFGIASITVFVLLLGDRDPSIAPTQLLVTTRAPDLLNQPQLFAFVALAALGYAWWRGRVDIHAPGILFAFSFTLMPFVVFNQQILTGVSLQPIHYQVFIANYVALIAIVLVSFNLWRVRYGERRVPASALALVAVVAFAWGVLEVSRATERVAQKTKLRDDMSAVASRIVAMANEDGLLPAALAGGAPFPTVFTSAVDETLEVSLSLPTYGSLSILWSLHSDAFISPAESKERYYRHLYYSGLTPKMVEARMRQNDFWVVVPLFGSERVVPGLVQDYKPIRREEILAEKSSYADFYTNFSREHAASPGLDFVVVPDGPNLPNFDNLDRWYERGDGEKVGAFTIHRVKLRPQT